MIRDRLTYANVMATLSFFVAVGGVGYAAATIDSGDVVNDSLRSKDLRNPNAVKGVDVKNEALTGDDVQENTLSGVNAELLDGINSDAFARVTARRQQVNSGFGSTPLVVEDFVGQFQLLCNDPDAENSELRFYAPAQSVSGAGDRDSWVTLDGGAPSYENLATLATPEFHAVDLDQAAGSHRVVWQVSPEPPLGGEIVTAVFSFTQADTTNAPCQIVGQGTLGLTSGGF